jgi:integrase
VTIRKRRGGWQIIVYAGLDPLTGKQRQITRQVNGSRREAEKVEARLRTEVADGQHAGTRLKTLGELLDLWIERRAASDKPISPDTVEDYRSLIAKKIKPALGESASTPSTLASLTPSMTICGGMATPKPHLAREPAPGPRRLPGARTRARLSPRRSPARATSD